MREYLIVTPWGTEWRINTFAPTANIRKPRPKILRGGLQEFMDRDDAAFHLFIAHNRRGWKLERVA